MKHTRHDLSFTYSRRTFFRALFQEAVVTYSSFKGRPGYNLSELGSLPDNQLALVKPIVNPDCEIFVDQGNVWSRSKKAKVVLKLFPTEQKNLTVFNMFNGQYDLGEIGERLSREMGWDKSTAFAYVRDLFLTLVERLVCLPRDPLEFER